MTRLQAERLLETLAQSLSDPIRDEQVTRHTKGLIAALGRWLHRTEPARSTTQARIGTPRHSGHASTDASLANQQEKAL